MAVSELDLEARCKELTQVLEEEGNLEVGSTW
jgi:hypothetical protein